MRRAAVLGAGVMGAGIAAHLANAGLEVLLLDRSPDHDGPHDALARTALERLRRSEPAALMHPRFAARITPGSFERDLARLAGCEWVIEAIVEDLEAKRALYRRIGLHLGDGAVLSSNTSTLPAAALSEGLERRLRESFLITHFFNPPRYMRLLELVPGPQTRPEVVARIAELADRDLGKSVIVCKDAPGFVANRIGGFWMQAGVALALAGGIAVEEADAALAPYGIPRTGLFGLLDLIGLDLLPAVAASLAARLPKGDPFQEVAGTPEPVARLIAAGRTGRKGGGGFYRLRKGGGERVKEALDLDTGEYRTAMRPERAGGRRALAEALVATTPAAAFARELMARTLAYAARVMPEVAHDAAAVDLAMRHGYGWREGPFELIDRIGADAFKALLEAAGTPLPPLLAGEGAMPCYRSEGGTVLTLGEAGGHVPLLRPEGVVQVAEIRKRQTPLLGSREASLIDLGDGVLAFVLHAKMNAISPEMLALLERSVDLVAERHQALVIAGEGDDFSVGVNLGLVLFAANLALWPMLDDALQAGQRTFRRLREAPFPVVGAAQGMALGGGLELLLHCDAVVAHAETYAGLPEVGVGLVPAWGGCTRMLARAFAAKGPGGPMPPVMRVFETLGMAKVARSAFEARDLLFLADTDEIVMNRDRVLAAAKAKALALCADYRPPAAGALALPGPSGQVALGLALEDLRLKGKATAHDAVVAGRLARVLSGGDADLTTPVPEAAIQALEREVARALLRDAASLARMEHMLATGRPLRN